MPAETHQRSEAVGVDAVLDLLACVVGLDAPRAAQARLADLELDDDLSVLHLWDAVVEEYGERSVGDLDLDGTRPATLGDLADLFARELTS
ncbi:MAG: hypothetical protein AB7H92_09505 [Microbacteriaceae bacterium]